MEKLFRNKINGLMNKPNLAEIFVQDHKFFGGGDKKVILYGCGHAARYYIKYLEKRGIKIAAVVDRVRKEPILDIPVDTFENIIFQYDIKYIDWVISAPSLRKEIREFLLKYTEANKIFSFEVELYEYYNTDSQKYKLFLEQNIDGLADIYMKLADDFSRETMLKVIEGRLTGDLDIVSDIWVKNQYWPEDIIHFTGEENVIECGSSDGKTLKELYEQLNGKYNHIYCFEPDAECVQILKDIIKDLDSHGGISLIQKGTYRETATLHFVNEGVDSGLSHVSENGESIIECVAIDDVIQNKVTYIKMDIEGAELDTLVGAERVIRENRPKLAVCIYHKDEDILNIIRYLQGLNLGYDFYIRHHNCNMTETVLYAI